MDLAQQSFAFAAMCKEKLGGVVDGAERAALLKLIRLCEREAVQIERSWVSLAESRRVLQLADDVLGGPKKQYASSLAELKAKSLPPAVMRIATGEKPEDYRPEDRNDPVAESLGRKGGA